MRVELRDWMRKFLEAGNDAAPADDCELALHVAGVRLRAWVTPDRYLVAEVDVDRWTPPIERALYEALDQRSASLIAGLLLWEWGALRAECEVAGREQRQLLFANVG